MATTQKRSKKALTQLMIAAGVALILGIGAIGLTLMLINTVATSAEQEKQLALQEAEKAKTELEKIKKESSTVPGRFYWVAQARTDIPAGTILRENLLTQAQLKEEPKEKGVIASASEAVGQMTTVELKAGETLTWEKLLESGSSLPVQEGMRAITIPVDPIAGLNGALAPGSFVDVLTTLKTGEEKNTRTLLQGVLVLDVGSDTLNTGSTSPSGPNAAGSPSTAWLNKKKDKNTVRSITLSVTPQQAELVALANLEGKFHLTLRNDKDLAKAPVKGANVGKLLLDANKVMVKKLPPPPPILRFKPSPHQTVSFQPQGFSNQPNLGSGNGLPFPSTPQPEAEKAFTMTIYKGSVSEEKSFEQAL